MDDLRDIYQKEEWNKKKKKKKVVRKEAVP
jgi:hypothetical protein